MIYSDWMSYINDDVKITKLVIPGSHNSGSYGMHQMACCQNDDIFTQFEYGVRYFCIRLDTKRDGTIVSSHGISKGVEFEDILYQMRKMLDVNDTEFFIFDIREYYDQKIGPIKLKFKADPKKVDELLKKYIDPQKYALCDFANIGDVTMGDIRKSGKRYILLNKNKDYEYSSDATCLAPWDGEIFGSVACDFVDGILALFDKNNTDGFYWLQTQQTPNLGTAVGLTTPRKLDMSVRPYFKHIIEQIAVDSSRLEKVNIIAGDFMTYDHSKVRDILRLNLVKCYVKSDIEAEYEKGLYDKKTFEKLQGELK